MTKVVSLGYEMDAGRLARRVEGEAGLEVRARRKGKDYVKRTGGAF